MLVLSRNKGETITIAEGTITITVLRVRGDRVDLAIEAPKDIDVRRGELSERKPKDDYRGPETTIP